VTLIFDLLTSGSLHAYGLPRMPETRPMSTDNDADSSSRFSFRGAGGETDRHRHTHQVTDTTNNPIHAWITSGVGNMTWRKL